jgi:hypothetical protein
LHCSKEAIAATGWTKHQSTYWLLLMDRSPLPDRLVDLDRLWALAIVRAGGIVRWRESGLLFQPGFDGVIGEIQPQDSRNKTIAKGDWFFGQFFKNRCQFIQKHRIYRLNICCFDFNVSELGAAMLEVLGSRSRSPSLCCFPVRVQ